MNDFATEDFLNKNIRVRPVSGVTKGYNEQDEQKTEVQSHYYGNANKGG